jgi:hypothetical protein
MFGTLWPARLLFPTCVRCGDVVYLNKRPYAASRNCKRCGAERTLPPERFEVWRTAFWSLYLSALLVYGWVWLLLWPVNVLLWRPLKCLLGLGDRDRRVNPRHPTGS